VVLTQRKCQNIQTCSAEVNKKITKHQFSKIMGYAGRKYLNIMLKYFDKRQISNENDRD
jgi:hypothetical protein